MNIRRYATMILGVLIFSFISVRHADSTARNDAPDLPAVFYGFYVDIRFQHPMTMAVKDKPSVFGKVRFTVRSACFSGEFDSVTGNSRCHAYGIPYVHLTGRVENGWFEVRQVQYPNQTGWILGDFSEIVSDPFSKNTIITLKNFWETYHQIVPGEFMITEDNVLARNGPHFSAGTHVHNWKCSEHFPFRTRSGEKICRYVDTFQKGDRVMVEGYQGNYYKIVAIGGIPHEPIWIYKEFLKSLSFQP